MEEFSYKSKLPYKILYFLAGVGILDTLYISSVEASDVCKPSDTKIFGTPLDCGEILESEYSRLNLMIFDLPLMYLGLMYYISLIFILGWTIKSQNISIQTDLAIFCYIGLAFAFAQYLLFIQISILEKMCLYCFYSWVISTSIFVSGISSIGYNRKVIK